MHGGVLVQERACCRCWYAWFLLPLLRQSCCQMSTLLCSYLALYRFPSCAALAIGSRYNKSDTAIWLKIAACFATVFVFWELKFGA